MLFCLLWQGVTAARSLACIFPAVSCRSAGALAPGLIDSLQVS
jgi:hypothetical protein